MEVVADALDSLPQKFRMRMKNVAVLVEDYPPQPAIGNQLILGHFIGIPATKRSTFDLPTMPDRVVLYQRNIEAVSRTEEEIEHQIRMTVIHEVGHYFGLSEEELKHV